MHMGAHAGLEPDLGALCVTPISAATGQQARAPEARQMWRHSLPHSLPNPALLWMIRGYARLIVEGRSMGVGPNACLCLPAGTPFAVEPGGQMQASLLQVPQTPLLPFPAEVHLVRVEDMSVQAEMTGLLDEISRGLARRAPGDTRAALARAMLVSSLLEGLTRTTTQSAASTASQRLAARFAAEAEACFETGATLNEIGARLDVSPTHLTRTLRETCGRTAARYLNDRVMHAARDALVTTDMPAAEIARRLGFSSPAYFSRAFLHHAGEPPGAFRNRNRSPARHPRNTGTLRNVSKA